MSSNNNSTGSGIGFCGLLTIAFIVLKLTGYIAWSWWWVLAPSLIPAVLIILLLAILGVRELVWYFKRKSRR